MPPRDGFSFFSGGEKTSARVRILQGIFVAIFLVYAARLFAMQILNGEVYQSRAEHIARRTAVIAARRGEIFDRNFGAPLVSNTDSFAVSVTPAEIGRDEIETVLTRLAGILRVPREQIARRVPASSYYLYQPVEVASGLSFAAVSSIAENADKLPGVSWQPKPVRNYAELGSLSHITGYVGNITQEELTMMYNQGYQQGDIIGKTGLERQYDDFLRGRKGRETRTVDVRGRRVTGDENLFREAPEPGKNLVLTVDRSIQTLAEKALGKRMGAIVVLRPSNGEILAMVSWPWYDPNIFTHADAGSEYQALISDPNKPLLNRAIQSSYPPASTFKIVMTTGILSEGVFSPEQSVECSGEVAYGDRLFHCHVGKPGHGRLNLQRAMAKSCDIYYWVVGRDHLGVERIVNHAREYGFGETAGIDLPGEIAGFVPTPQWKDRRFHERWLGGDTMNMSIGQGYTLVTPLQMANMTAMTVNDGVVYRPHVLKEVRDPVSGAVESAAAREVIHRSTVTPEIFARVRRDMRTVISEGTAQFPLNIKSVQIAGKTGTGEVGLQNRWHSWFTAFAPYETANPEERVVVSIIVEAVNDWEWWAPYASAIIFQGIFARETYEDAVRSLGLQYIMPIQGRRE
ncbi:MAG: penicillin-binding protein 2 [Spirochaetaceae bacterium]|nr:penicillin-binding protein 2 [Spirochaetaceae bacterium]